MFSYLPVELKVIISSFGGSYVWYLLTRIDDNFKLYTKSNLGKNQYINLFTKIVKGKSSYRLNLYDDKPSPSLYGDGKAIEFFDNTLYVTYDYKDEKTYYTGYIGNIPFIPKGLDIAWLKNNVYHRKNGPAVICNNGQDLYYYKNGKLHQYNNYNYIKHKSILTNNNNIKKYNKKYEPLSKRKLYLNKR